AKTKYRIGDVLWVRETFEYFSATLDFCNDDSNSSMVIFNYKATDRDILISRSVTKELAKKALLDIENGKQKNSNWKPSIFMPKEACRIFLKIKDVRVERLQGIIENDAISEGVKYDKQFKSYHCYLCQEKKHKGAGIICEDGFFDNAFESFRSL